jgi:negative regulator of flagellin synthesis FlgM
MKVDNSIKKPGDLPVGESRLRRQQGAEKARKNDTSVDSVQLSTASLQLPSPSNGLGSGGVFDAERVEAIKLAMAEGRLEVSPEKIADGLLSAVSDFLKLRTF